jgi:hypothetical protein
MRHARTREVTRRRSASAVLAATALAAALLAGSAAPAVGVPLSDIAASFVDVGVGAGPMGMAGAVVAGATGAEAVFWNPASVGRGEAEREFLASYCDQMGLVPYSAASGAVALGSEYALGIGILCSGDDVLREVTGLAALARTMPAPPWCSGRPAGVGVALKGRWASYGNNESTDDQVTGDALGGGLDAGVVVPLTASLTLGVAGRDLANTLRWDSSAAGSYGEGVPAALVVGIAADPRPSLRIEVDLDKALRADNGDVVAAGASLSIADVAVLRAGYRRALPPDEFEEYAVGCGAAVPTGHGRITLDVAYLFGRLDDTLRLTVGFRL